MVRTGSHQQIDDHQGPKKNTGNTIGRKKCKVYPAEVVGLNQTMLVKKEQEENTRANPE